MKRLYFIYSMPRSGSAWLSLFLSQQNSFCFHEPFADNPSWEWLYTRMLERPEQCVGAIDTSAYMRDDYFHFGLFAYYLYRPLSLIIPSVKKLGDYGYDTESEYVKCQSKCKALPKIHWQAFGSIEYLETLWKAITTLPFDRERSEVLMEMNVQRSPTAVKQRALGSSRGSST